MKNRPGAINPALSLVRTATPASGTIIEPNNSIVGAQPERATTPPSLRLVRPEPIVPQAATSVYADEEVAPLSPVKFTSPAIFAIPEAQSRQDHYIPSAEELVVLEKNLFPNAVDQQAPLNGSETKPNPPSVLEALGVLRDSVVSFLEDHPVVAFPTEILLTLPFIAPFLSSKASQAIVEYAPNSPFLDLIINTNQLAQFAMPSALSLTAYLGIGLFAAGMNSGLSSMGSLTKWWNPEFKSPQEFTASDTTQSYVTSTVSLLKQITVGMVKGGTNAISDMSNATFDTPFTDYQAQGTGLASRALASSARTYGGLVESFESALPEPLKFLALTLPHDFGHVITHGVGILGSASFYFLFNSLIGTSDEGSIYWLLGNSILLAPLVHTLNSKIHGKDLHAKAWADVKIYFLLNVTLGICAGPNFTEGFKFLLDVGTRLSIISMLAYSLHQLSLAETKPQADPALTTP